MNKVNDSGFSAAIDGIIKKEIQTLEFLLDTIMIVLQKNSLQ